MMVVVAQLGALLLFVEVGFLREGLAPADSSAASELAVRDVEFIMTRVRRMSEEVCLQVVLVVQSIDRRELRLVDTLWKQGLEVSWVRCRWYSGSDHRV